MKQAINNLSKADPVKLAVAAVIVLGVVYFMVRKTVSDSAQAVGGILSGNNDLTAGSPYEGAGVLGTVGAATNKLSGGVLQKFGEYVGGVVFDVIHPQGK